MTASVLVLAVSLLAPLQRVDAPVRVLLDCSREYPASWEALDQDVGHFEVTRSFATMSPEVLAGQDVVVVYYNHSDLPWTAVMTEAALAFVRRGGGLLLVGHGGHWREEHSQGSRYPIYQLNRLGKPLGYALELAPERCNAEGALSLLPSELAEGLTTYAADGSPGIVTDLTGTSTGLVTDEDGGLVLAMKPYGIGRVACSADPDGLTPGGTNAQLLARVLMWLAGGERDVTRAALTSHTIWPEARCEARGLHLAMARTFCSQEEAEVLQGVLNNVSLAVASSLDTEPVRSTAITVLPYGTPAGPADARVLYDWSPADPWPLLTECSTALVRDALGPGMLPGQLDEALIEWYSLRALAELGFPRATAELAEHHRAVREADPDVLSTASPLLAIGEPGLRALSVSRGVAMLSEFSKQYGSDLWPEFLSAKRRHHTSLAPVGRQELLALLSDAGAPDAEATFTKLGITLPEPLPLPKLM